MPQPSRGPHCDVSSRDRPVSSRRGTRARRARDEAHRTPRPEDSRSRGTCLLNPEWLSNTLERASTTDVGQEQHDRRAIERRDQAIADWKAATGKAKAYPAAGQAGAKARQARAKAEGRPTPRRREGGGSAKADKAEKRQSKAKTLRRRRRAEPVREARVHRSSGRQAERRRRPRRRAQRAASTTRRSTRRACADLLNPQFLPGLDGFQVIDMRKLQRRRHATTPTTARSSTSSSCRCRGASRPRRTTCSTSGRTASRSSPARCSPTTTFVLDVDGHPEPVS